VKILQVISQLSDFMGDSGQVLNFARIFQERGHDVTIVTTDGDPFFNNIENSKKYQKTREILEKNQGEQCEINGIKVIPVHCTKPSLGMYSPESSKFAKKLVNDFDVIHVYSWYHHLGMVFAKISIEFGKPLFVSFWGTLQPEAQKYNKILKSFADSLYTKKTLQKATGIHSIGISETEIYKKMGVEKNRIFSIDNGIVLEDFKKDNTSKIFQTLDIDKEKNNLLFLGRIHEKKGIELFLEATKRLLSQIKDINIIIAGSGEEKYVSKVKTKVKELGLEKIVKFSGFISHQDKLELLDNATVFVLTSHSDIHPRAVQEALTMGLPVLITENCDYPEVEKYKCGRIVQPNIESIHDGLLDLLNNSDLKNASDNAKKLINEKFLMDIQIEKFESMYKNSI